VPHRPAVGDSPRSDPASPKREPPTPDRPISLRDRRGRVSMTIVSAPLKVQVGGWPPMAGGIRPRCMPISTSSAASSWTGQGAVPQPIPVAGRRRQVLVFGPEGRRVSSWSARGNETITKGSQIYSNAVGFDVSAPGKYSVTITSVAAVIIAPSLGAQLGAAPWIILTGIGFPVALVGLVLLIKESKRRKQGWVIGSSGWQPA
jgi:hypothetical protein